MTERKNMTVALPARAGGAVFPSKHLAAFYYQLGTMTQAGMPIRRALHALTANAPRPLRPTVLRLAAWVDGGATLHEGLQQFPARFPALDRHLVAVSEQSGALDTGLLSLSKYHESRDKARSRVVSACLFPAILLVAAVFISRFPALVLGTLGPQPYGALDYARDTVGFLLLLTLGGWLAVWAARSLMKIPALSVPVDRLLRALPVFGPLRFHFALSQWLNAIRLMLNAGYGVLPAIEQAGQLLPSPLIARGCAQVRTLVEEGSSVSDALRATGVFPEKLLQFWASGEESGRTDEMLARLAVEYEEDWQKSLAVLAAWLPRIAYVLVSLYILWQIATLLGPLIGAYGEALQG